MNPSDYHSWCIHNPCQFSENPERKRKKKRECDRGLSLPWKFHLGLDSFIWDSMENKLWDAFIVGLEKCRGVIVTGLSSPLWVSFYALNSFLWDPFGEETVMCPCMIAPVKQDKCWEWCSLVSYKIIQSETYEAKSCEMPHSGFCLLFRETDPERIERTEMLVSLWFWT